MRKKKQSLKVRAELYAAKRMSGDEARLWAAFDWRNGYLQAQRDARKRRL